MCGIVGMMFRAGIDNRSDELEVFTRMLLSAQSRGQDATGLMLLNKNPNGPNDLYMLKSPLCAKDLVETDEYREFINHASKNTCWVVGHTRASTQGGPEKIENNHPHNFEDFWLLHNGSIDNFEGMKSVYAGIANGMKTDCDTEFLVRLIGFNIKNSRSTKEQACTEAMLLLPRFVHTIGALVFVDTTDPSTLRLYRDPSRPLHILEISAIDTNIINTVIFGSTESIIEEANALTSVKNIKRFIKEVAPFTVYELRQGLGLSAHSRSLRFVTKYGEVEDDLARYKLRCEDAKVKPEEKKQESEEKLVN
jgi:glucosamine 6-phosphate synthetase-like amidotransferase/phosphosugar isomerase protein